MLLIYKQILKTIIRRNVRELVRRIQIFSALQLWSSKLFDFSFRVRVPCNLYQLKSNRCLGNQAVGTFFNNWVIRLRKSTNYGIELKFSWKIPAVPMLGVCLVSYPTTLTEMNYGICYVLPQKNKGLLFKSAPIRPQCITALITFSVSAD